MNVRNFKNFEWIDLTNPDRKELIRITEAYQLELNMLDDSIEAGHLPKIERADGYAFVILRAYTAKEDDIVTTVGELSNKIAFFVTENRLITIHRTAFPFLSNVNEDFASAEALVLKIINDMLLTFDKPLQHQCDKMDSIEKEIFLCKGKPISIEDLYYQKSKARISRKVLQFTQNVLSQFKVKPENNTHLQDIIETTVHYLLLYDEVIEDANNLLNTHLSINAKKSNDVMKLLTIFSAFFLPLTFIAGIYGMNFRHMPELKWAYGYFMALGLMIFVAFVIFFWFKRKKMF